MFVLPLMSEAQQRVRLRDQPQEEQKPNPWYFGGSLGAVFGSYTAISVLPMVGYNLSPKASVGFRGMYEYIKDKRYSNDFTTSNYGGGIFARYNVTRSLYASAEFDYYSYGYSISNTETVRNWVPFLYLGGGYYQSLGGKSTLFIEVLFDVIQDPNSPYPNWEPLIRFGVGVGL